MFFDAFQAAIGSCTLDDAAFFVLASVIGSYPARGELLLDAGALALSKDEGPRHVRPDCGYGVLVHPLSRRPARPRARRGEPGARPGARRAGGDAAQPIGAKVLVSRTTRASRRRCTSATSSCVATRWSTSGAPPAAGEISRRRRGEVARVPFGHVSSAIRRPGRAAGAEGKRRIHSGAEGSRETSPRAQRASAIRRPGRRQGEAPVHSGAGEVAIPAGSRDLPSRATRSSAIRRPGGPPRRGEGAGFTPGRTRLPLR